MEKFSADRYYELGHFLGDLKARFEEFKAHNPDEDIGGLSASSKTYKRLEYVRTLCREIGLTISVKYADALLILVIKPSNKAEPVIEGLTHLEKTIQLEMEEKLFMFIPPERAKVYNQADLLGKDVLSKFPALQYDIVEAGNCYTTGRSTAVVFHLMRIMESGVQAFGSKLGVALVNEKNWQNILDEANKKIRLLPPKAPQTVELSEVSANLYAVKLAWRNEVMHPNDTYTLEEAENLINQVRIYMQNLVKVI
jgi:hypothetical protein